jgi:hypothetical protein
MILTAKSIEKNLETVTADNEHLSKYLAVKSNVHKRGILALSSFNRFYVTNAPLSGKIKVLDTFLAREVEYADYISEIKMGSPVVHLFIKALGKEIKFTAFFHPVNNDTAVNKMISSIYSANPTARPEYLTDTEVIDYLTAKDGTYKLTKNEIIVQTLSKDVIQEKEIIHVKDITDYDVYPQKLGSKGILYLELNNQPRIVKFEKTTEEHSIGAILSGGTSAMFGLGKLSSMLRDSEIQIKSPSYMAENETELVTEFASKSTMGIDELGNKIFRLTDKNIYLLKKEPSGKLSPIEKIPLTAIAGYKSISHRSNDTTIFGLSVTTNDNKTHKFWSLELIDWIMAELNKICS